MLAQQNETDNGEANDNRGGVGNPFGPRIARDCTIRLCTRFRLCTLGHRLHLIRTPGVELGQYQPAGAVLSRR